MSKKTETTYSDIQKAVADSKSVLILSHSSPDGDSIASQLGFRNYLLEQGHDVEVVNEGTIPKIYDKLPGIEQIRDIDDFTTNKQFDLAVVLDCSNLERVGKAIDIIKDAVPIINIDHHPDNTAFGAINLVDKVSSSTSEILTEYFLNINHRINKSTATLLYAGILTDTGRFRYESTSRRTMELVGVLIESGAEPRNICDDIYYSISPSKLKITGKMFESAEFYEDGKICLMELSQENIKLCKASMSDFNGLADFTLHTKGALVGALLEEIDDKTVKVSLRSKNDFNVSKVAHIFGGGGHFNASGYIMKSSLATNRNMLLDNLKGLINATV